MTVAVTALPWAGVSVTAKSDASNRPRMEALEEDSRPDRDKVPAAFSAALMRLSVATVSRLTAGSGTTKLQVLEPLMPAKLLPAASTKAPASTVTW